MKVLRYPKPGLADIEVVSSPTIGPNQALGRTMMTNVSAGTELAFFLGTAPQRHWSTNGDGLWEPAQDHIVYPMRSSDPGCWWMGYAAVVEIEEVGKEMNDLRVGDRVFTHQGHKEYQVIEDDYHVIPNDLDVTQASYAALTEIAFNGMLDATVKLADRVVIFGMGTLGQLLLQMCKMSGAEVAVVDLWPNRLKIAKEQGADLALNPKTESNIEHEIIELWGSGADLAFEATGNSNVLKTAIRCVRPEGQVTVLSFYQSTPDDLNLGREFHHNRVMIRSSQVGGINPKWSWQYNRRRRMDSVTRLLSRLNTKDLVSHQCELEEYPEVLNQLSQNPSEFGSILIKY